LDSSSGSDNGAILAKLDRLESLLLQVSGSHTGPGPLLQQPTPESDILGSGRSNVIAPHKLDVQKLESVGTRENLMLNGLHDGVSFEILSIEQICSPSLHTSFAPTSPLNARRIIMLPSLVEALELFEIYVNHVEYLHHVLLLPRLKKQLYSAYDYLQYSQHNDPTYQQYSSNPRPPPILAIPLLLVVFASSAACISELRSKIDRFMPDPPANSTRSFLNAAKARQCCAQWLKNAFECLDYSPHIGLGCIEDVQALTVGFFLVYQLEGFSARARTGIGRAILIARDIGLHKLDFGNDSNRDQAEVEIARRTWWHLCASDWLVALSGGPQEGVYHLHANHMKVNLPRNIQDSELMNPNTPADFEHPLSVPTSASYLIQRIKLAKICKKIVDTMPMTPSTPEMIPYEEIIQLDKEFSNLIDNLPPFYLLSQPLTQGYYNTTPESRVKMLDVFGKADAGSAPNFVPGDVTPDHVDIQRFMVRLTAHTRRCKFHQPFLVRGFTDPQYHYSRDVCLRSARIVLEMQQALEAQGLAATTGLLGLSGLNHHVFFATIALVMDLCFNRTEAIDELERKAEVKRAIDILAVSENRSLVAKKFLEGIREVLRKYRVDLGDEQSQQAEQNMSISESYADNVAELVIPEPQPSDFEDIWQTYLDVPSVEVPGWDELFGEADPMAT
jgi:hypothetical protein